MSEFVFIVGAGFSKLAGAPLMSDFLERAERLLPKDESYINVSNAMSEMQRAHSKADIDLLNVESVFGAFEMAKMIGSTQLKSLGSLEAVDKLIKDLKTTIANTLENSVEFPATRTPHHWYGKFAELVKRLSRPGVDYSCSIITLNYDLILDHTFTLVRNIGL